MNLRMARSAAGFTLIELMISGALMALILAAAYACLHAGFTAQKFVEPRVDAAQSARVAMNLIAADLRSACPLDKEVDFAGMDRTVGSVEADNVDFATHNYTPRREYEGDYCQVSYFVEQDSASGDFILWRRRNPMIGLDPYSGGRREEIARGIRRFSLEYYDGVDWYDTWGDPDGRAREETSLRTQYNLSGMPEAVRITLWIDPSPPAPRAGGEGLAEPGTTSQREPPLVFQTVARLNLASRTSLGGTATSGSSGSSGSSSNPQGNPGFPGNPP